MYSTTRTGYYYQVLVTNLSWRPLRVWRFYNQRARIEQLIRELKGEYALGSIPTRQYAANEAHLHLLFLAYNCVRWFQHLCLPEHFATTRLQRLREDVLNMQGTSPEALGIRICGYRTRASPPTGCIRSPRSIA